LIHFYKRHNGGLVSGLSSSLVQGVYLETKVSVYEIAVSLRAFKAIKMSYISEACLISALWFFHAAFSLYVYVTMYSQAAVRICKKIIGGRNPVEGLIELKEGLDKIPKHIAFILLEDSINYSTTASLIAWSLVVGIENISLYDPAGELKQNQDTLLIKLNEKLKEFNPGVPLSLTWWSHSETLVQDRTVIVSKNGAMYPDVNGNGRIQINGDISEAQGAEGASVNISLLSKVDGKADIARCARQLSSQLCGGALTAVNKINEEMVAANLSSNRNLSDPSLVVRLGQFNSNADFLPWQLRLSEFHSIDCTLALEVTQFTDVLRGYSRCQQRFGK